MDQYRLDIIGHYPIGKRLEGVYRIFDNVCKNRQLPSTVDSLDECDDEDLHYIALSLFHSLSSLPAAHQLHTDRGDMVSGILSQLEGGLDAETIEPIKVMPLMKAFLKRTSDIETWREVLDILEEESPSQPTLSVQQTPGLYSPDKFPTSGEYQDYLNAVLKEEFGSLHVGLRDFHKTFFGGISNLEEASKEVFQRCSEGGSRLYDKQRGVWLCPENITDTSWFSHAIKRMVNTGKELWSNHAPLRSIAQPHKQLKGSIEEQKLDIGLVDDPRAEDYFKYPWSRILVLGQLRNSSDSDDNLRAWLDLGRYAKEVLSAHESRRFVLGFTLFGNLMRVWMFDRLGGFSSDSFDIHTDGLRFVSTMLGFLLMNGEQLGFDPTIMTVDGKRFIQVERNGQTERLVLNRIITRSHHISGRGTTCWKAYHENSPRVPLVIKDSWMLEDARDEGELLREVTEKGVANVARHYHHEIVQVSGINDDVQKNVRKGLDATKAEDYSSSWDKGIGPCKNRVHRRIIVRDYGRPIHHAPCLTTFLIALEGCIRGHESLWKAGIVHRDISIDNLMICSKKDRDGPTWPSFLIDLDLAIEEQLNDAREKITQTGTRPFMAIQILSGARHSFMHDIESFFWVLFLICIQHEGPGGAFRRVEEFDSWSNQHPTTLAMNKLGIISMEEEFLDLIGKHFSTYYQSLIPWVNKLRRLVFPNDSPSMTRRPEIYSEIYRLLREAQAVFAEQDSLILSAYGLSASIIPEICD